MCLDFYDDPNRKEFQLGLSYVVKYTSSCSSDDLLGFSFNGFSDLLIKLIYMKDLFPPTKLNALKAINNMYKSRETESLQIVNSDTNSGRYKMHFEGRVSQGSDGELQ